MTAFLNLRTFAAAAALSLTAGAVMAAPPPPVPTGALTVKVAANDRKVVGDIQLGLEALGYDPGLIDGIMGPNTAGAIKAYQSDHDLAADGKASAKLLGHIRRNPKMQGVGLTPVLRDDFEDGDLTNNPPWHIHSGKFAVAKGFMSVKLPGAQANSAGPGDPLRGLFGGADLAGKSAIAQGNDVPNAFRLVATVLGSARDSVRMHMGPYNGKDVTTGYRISYDQKANGRLMLVRSKGRETTVLAEANGVTALGDGRRHLVVWTRDAAGRMSVKIDRKEVLAAQDTTFRSDFSGFSFVNVAGVWNLHDISIYSMR